MNVIALLAYIIPLILVLLGVYLAIRKQGDCPYSKDFLVKKLTILSVLGWIPLFIIALFGCLTIRRIIKKLLNY